MERVMVPVRNKVKSLLSLNHTTKTIYHHHSCLKKRFMQSFFVRKPCSEYLQFTRRIFIHYLKSEKIACQLPPNIIYPRNKSCKRSKQVPENEWVSGQQFVKNKVRKTCRVYSTRPRTWCLLWKGELWVKLCFKVYHIK